MSIISSPTRQVNMSDKENYSPSPEESPSDESSEAEFWSSKKKVKLLTASTDGRSPEMRTPLQAVVDTNENVIKKPRSRRNFRSIASANKDAEEYLSNKEITRLFQSVVKPERRKMGGCSQRNDQLMVLPKATNRLAALASIEAGTWRKRCEQEQLELIKKEDPKKASRILANRRSAQRSRNRRLEQIAALEVEVAELKEELGTLRKQFKKVNRDLMKEEDKCQRQDQELDAAYHELQLKEKLIAMLQAAMSEMGGGAAQDDTPTKSTHNLLAIEGPPGHAEPEESRGEGQIVPVSACTTPTLRAPYVVPASADRNHTPCHNFFGPLKTSPGLELPSPFGSTSLTLGSIPYRGHMEGDNDMEDHNAGITTDTVDVMAAFATPVRHRGHLALSE